MPSAVDSFKVIPVEKAADDKSDAGAIITGIDLNDLTDEDVQKLKEAVWTYRVVVIKNQQNLKPIKQWELINRFDPTSAHKVHGHGPIKDFKKVGGFLAKLENNTIPEAPEIRLVAKGYQGEDHYGIKNLTAKGISADWHHVDVEPSRLEAGQTRFQRWHIDAALYGRDPSFFTILRAIKLPKGPDVTINWDDGSGLTRKAKVGQTAFISNFQTYQLLSEEEKKLADHSWVDYGPFPYKRVENCKGNTTGLGIYNQGKETSVEELPPWEPNDIKRYPLVWVNPHTGEKAFQVHALAVYKLYLRSSPDEEPRVVSDVHEIRAFLANIQNRVLKPEYVYFSPAEEGDVTIWDNRGLFHTAVDYPLKYGPRTMHQANLGSSIPPTGPVEIPAKYLEAY